MVFGFGGDSYTSFNPAWIKWLIVVLALVIVVLAIMMVAGVDVTGVISAPTLAAKQLTFWKMYDPLVPLRVTYDQVRDTPFDRYTLMIDMVWLNTRVDSSSTTYRHIFHRGSGEAANYLQNMKPNIADAAASGTTKKAPTLGKDTVLQRMPQGIPTRMNPGVLADPITNDMLVFIDTLRDGRNYRESVRIPDIPMDQPFRLALVVMPNMLEVYINCRLEVTKLLEGRPRTMEADWYGLVGPQPLNAAIQMLRIFNEPLSHHLLRPYCLMPFAFPEGIMVQCNK